MHLAIADVVNDAHGNEFWMSIGSLAGKARVSRSSAWAALQTMTEDGFLVMLESGEAKRKPSRYRFVPVDNPVTVPVSDTTSATTGTASAVGDIALARSARANSIELNQLKVEPTSALSGTDEKTAAPWVIEGIPRDEWNERNRAKEAGA